MPSRLQEHLDNDVAASKRRLDIHIKNNKHMKLRPADADLDKTAEAMAKMAAELNKMGCPRELARDLSLLWLYDIAILLDDSTSMQEEDSGNRIKHLRELLKAICQIYQLVREDGIPHVEFLNSEGAEDVTDYLVDELVDIDWVGITPIGTMLKAKILDPLVFNRPGSEKMQKPLIVITITDGDVEGEEKGTLTKGGVLETNVIRAITALENHEYLGQQDLGFMFAQVGNSEEAKGLLKRLDGDKNVGKRIDCFINGDLSMIEDKDMKWMILRKLLLGAVVPSIDDDDNKMGIEGERLLAEEAITTRPGKRVLKGRKQKATATKLSPQPLRGNSASVNVPDGVAANGAFPKPPKGNPNER